MKKSIFLALIMVFSLGASTVFGANSERKTAEKNLATTEKTENKLSEEEISRLTKRVEEIRDMDKTSLTGMEKREMKNELKTIKENVRNSDGVIYISAGTLILVIILLILIV